MLFFDVDAPEVLPEVVYDESHSSAGFQRYIERLGEYWKSRYPRSKSLDNVAIKRVATALRGDFTCVESLMPTVRGVKRKLLTLTEEQAGAVEGLKESSQVVVKGGAGAGKTVIAAHEALRMSLAGKRVLLTCFNKALAASLRASFAGTDVDVYHLDGLITELVREGETESEIPGDASRDDLFDTYRPMAAVSAMERLGRLGSYEAIVVDEGQDLITSGMIDVLDASLGGGIESGVWRVFWDPQQNLFFEDVEADLSLLTAHGGDPVRFVLTKNCRNSEEIAAHVEFLSGVELTELAFPAGADVLDRDWDGPKKSLKALRGVLKDLEEQGVDRSSVKVLSPRKFDSSVASQSLGGGLTIRDESGLPWSGESGEFSFSTIQSFKGLESDVVVLVDVDDLDSARMRSLMYVGASRARALLAVLRSEKTTPTFARRVLAREQRRQAEPRRPSIQVL